MISPLAPDGQPPARGGQERQMSKTYADPVTARADSMNRLLWMADHGSSVTLNWGEDNALWECSWIVGGKRFSAFSHDANEAIRRAVEERLRER